MALHRRTFLTGSGAAVASLAGCLDALESNQPALGLVLRNYTDRTQPLQLELLREAADGDDDPIAYEREFEVPPPTGDTSAGTVRRAELVPARRYLVRVRLKFGRGGWAHVHYVPASDSDDELDVQVYRDEPTGQPYVQFG